METLLAIIFVVFGLLQIILFFKIWGMTNDIKSIKSNLLENGRIKDAKVAYLNGHTDIAKRILDDGLSYAIKECEEYHYSLEAKKYKADIISTYKYLGIDIPKIEGEQK